MGSQEDAFESAEPGSSGVAFDDGRFPDHDTRISTAQLATLLKVSAALASSLELATVLQTAIASAVEVLGLDTGAIYTIESDHLYLGATVPPVPPGFPEELRHARLADHVHIRRCCNLGDPIYVEDATVEEWSEHERVVVDSRGLVTVFYIPLVSAEEIVGVLILGTQHQVRRFTEEHIDLARTLSHVVALAVTNSRLYERMAAARADLEHAYDATIAGWSHALEMRDEGTAGHTMRVMDLTVALTRRVAIPKCAILHVRRGALLHDLGKMVVPDAILHKPGPLNPDEWELMKSHPSSARAMIEHIEYLGPAMDIPYCHHERWDGSGYPQGLIGTQIPLAARVFAVVDVLDALTSDRPYRPAWSREDAIAHIVAQSGLHFDPAVVTALLEVLAEEGA